MKRELDASDVSDEEWASHEPPIPAAKPGGKPRITDMREVLNAIFDVNKSGGQCRLLPHEFAKWQTVYYASNTWRKAGLWSQWKAILREKVGVEEGRAATPSAAILASQSVKTTQKGGHAALTGQC